MATKQKWVIFGDNEYAITMIFETLYAIHKKSLEISIVINRKFTPQHPWNEDLHHIAMVNEEDFKADRPVFAFLAGMSPDSRQFLWKRFDKDRDNIVLPSLIHPSVVLPHHITIEEGVRIEPNVTIAPYVSVGKAALINRGAIIGHHTTIGDFVNINPGAIINGMCHIGAHATIGAGTIINDGVVIGSHCVIGSGSLVTKNIPDHTTAYGSPAKVINTHS